MLNYNEYKEMIDEHLLDFLPEIDYKSSTLYEAMKYSLVAGGKRIRPALLLGACEFVGGNAKAALPYACALEYTHTYMLIHDDLPAMDDDDMRRGKPTSHKQFGEAVAILAGDGLLASAFEAMNRDMLLYLDDLDKLKARIRAVSEIARRSGCRGMIAGQLADIEAEDKSCSKEMLDYIHINKTAELIVAAVRAGAYLGNAKSQVLQHLTEYAENVGLAFQIADDILDICGDEEQLGKRVGRDLRKKKTAYPEIHGMEASKAKLSELTDKAVLVMSENYADTDFFVDLARSLEVRCK